MCIILLAINCLAVLLYLKWTLPLSVINSPALGEPKKTHPIHVNPSPENQFLTIKIPTIFS